MDYILNPDNDDWVSVILKLPGESCNINCVYCYEKRKPYDSNNFMDPQKVRTFLDLLEDRPLAIELHGGEPLLIGKKKLKLIFDEINRYKGNKKVSIQTNGTMLDKEWINFLKENFHDIEIGISLDGNEDLNSYRVDYLGNATTSKVENAIKLLESENIDIGIISVVTKKTVTSSAELLLDYYAKFPAIKTIKFAPCMDYNVTTKDKPYNKIGLKINNGEGHAGWAIDPKEYSDFMNDVFNLWIEKEYFKQFVLEPSLSIMRKLLGNYTSFCHFNNQKCNHILTLYPDGRIGSCDELPIGISYHGHVDNIENINQLLEVDHNTRLENMMSKLMDKCKRCSYYEICGGGCMATRNRYLNTPYDDMYCDHRISMIENVNKSLSDIKGANNVYK